MRAKIDIRMF